MKSLCLFFALLSFLKVCNASDEDSPPWDYKEHGPHGWPGTFLSCAGSRQSPINIETNSDSIKPEYWEPMTFKYYNVKPIRARMKNNGHSAQKEIDASHAPRISSGGLKNDYVFVQLHFHWGEDDSQGSEHTLDGVRYPLEMHLVHYNDRYGTLKEAIKHPDGLAVLGVLFEITDKDNAAFTPIIESLGNIREANRVTEVAPKYSLDAYLPDNRKGFYRYLGSLTTPTCNEVVIWTVFKETVGISKRQLQAFRRLKTEHNNPLINNYRPPQLLRDRTVYMSVSENASEGSTMKKLGLAMYFMSTMAVLMMNM